MQPELKKLNDKIIELQMLNQQQKSYLSLLGHDAMSALANIQFCAEMLTADAELSPENRQWIQSIFRSQKKLAITAQNLSDLEKADRHHSLPLLCMSFDLIDLIQQTVDLISVEAQDRDLTVSFLTEYNKLEVSLDPARAERLILNIWFYLLKYTAGEGSIELQLLETKMEGVPCVSLVFKTDRLVIPFVAMQHGLNYFSSAPDQIERQTAAFLGLTVARLLAEQHKGTIEALSLSGNDICLRLCLPTL